MKQLLCFLCILCTACTALAQGGAFPNEPPQQRSLITHSNLTVEELNPEQRQRYDKLESLQLHVPGGLFLVTTAVPPDVEQGNSVTISSPLLPCGSITFTAATVEFKDKDNFSWSGRVIRSRAEDCASGDIIIQKNNGLFIGNFTIDDNSFELYDLTGRHLSLDQSFLN